MWWEGNSNNRIQPLRHVEAKDFHSKLDRKFFSEWRYVFKYFEKFLVNCGKLDYNKEITAKDITNYYKDIEEVLEYMSKLSTYKPKNIHSQKVSSLVKKVRFLIKNGYPN